MKRNFEENLLFHNTIDVWIKICEDNNVNIREGKKRQNS
jgi:hypothetical protein